MKKYLVLATLFVFSTSAYAANITWNGHFDYRYDKTSRKDGTTDNDAQNKSQSEDKTVTHALRASLGATGGWDNIEWGMTVGTTGNTNPPIGSGGATVLPNNTFVTFNNNTNGTQGDLPLGVREAWFRYGNDWGFGDLGFTIGRQAPAFRTGAAETFIDNDVRFDGFAETWKWGSFGVNFSQYILGGTDSNASGASAVTSTPSTRDAAGTIESIAVLYSWQLVFDWRFTDDIAADFWAGYHLWSNTVGAQYQNDVPNGNSGGINGAASLVGLENSRHWQFGMGWMFPYTIGVDFEIIINNDHEYGAPAAIGGIKAPNTNKLAGTAWSAGITFGELKKAQDFMIGYTYSDKGLGSIANAFTNENSPAGFNGHTIDLAYNVANNFHIGGQVRFLDEKDAKNNTGVAATGNAKMDRNYWNVMAGVQF